MVQSHPHQQQTDNFTSRLRHHKEFNNPYSELERVHVVEQHTCAPPLATPFPPPPPPSCCAVLDRVIEIFAIDQYGEALNACGGGGGGGDETVCWLS